jgi:hypothetical protein
MQKFTALNLESSEVGEGGRDGGGGERDQCSLTHFVVLLDMWVTLHGKMTGTRAHTLMMTSLNGYKVGAEVDGSPWSLSYWAPNFHQIHAVASYPYKFI